MGEDSSDVPPCATDDDASPHATGVVGCQSHALWRRNAKKWDGSVGVDGEMNYLPLGLSW